MQSCVLTPSPGCAVQHTGGLWALRGQGCQQGAIPLMGACEGHRPRTERRCPGCPFQMRLCVYATEGAGRTQIFLFFPFLRTESFNSHHPTFFFFFFFSRELKISPSALGGSGAAHKPAQRLCKYGCERRAAGGCYLQGRGTWGPNTSTANPSSPPMQGRLWPGRLLAARSYLMSGKCCSWEIGGCCRRGPAGSIRSCGHVQVLCVALPSGRLPARLRVTTLLHREQPHGWGWLSSGSAEGRTADLVMDGYEIRALVSFGWQIRSTLSGHRLPFFRLQLPSRFP